MMTLDQTFVQSNSSTPRAASDPISPLAGWPCNRSDDAASSRHSIFLKRLKCCRHPLNPPRFADIQTALKSCQEINAIESVRDVLVKKLQFLITTFCLMQVAACDKIKQPALDCRLSNLGNRPSADAPAREIVRRIKARLSNRSKSGVWNFDGTIESVHSNSKSSKISGHFYEYDDGGFDLVAATDEERITVMPSNPRLKIRGLTGVTMRNGQTVSSGRGLTAICRTSLPIEG